MFKTAYEPMVKLWAHIRQAYITCVIYVIWNDEDHWGGFHWFIQDADNPNEDGELTRQIVCPK